MMIDFKKYQHPIEVGTSFGLTSGVITTLGLMVGVYSSTASHIAVFSSIMTIAIADAMSDALGIHISEENENVHTRKEIWVATITTFLAKFCVSITFVVAILIWPLKTAVIINIIYGILLMTAYNIRLGIKQKQSTYHVVFEHLLITGLVITVSYYLGQLTNIILK